MSERPAPVYVCPEEGCLFEHWNGLEMYDHLSITHEYGGLFDKDPALLKIREIKLTRSKNWILKKIPPPEPKRVKQGN